MTNSLQSVDERTARELRGLARVLVRSGYADHAAITAALKATSEKPMTGVYAL